MVASQPEKPRSWTGRWVNIKGRRALRQAFPADFREEMQALGADLAGLGAHYLRRPGVWLVGGMIWWVVYLLCLLFCGIDFGASLSALLEITFAITAPPKAIAEAYRATFGGEVAIPLIVKLVGLMGWSVIVAFTLLIPAVIALILERLPNVVATLWPLASAEVWDFFQRYTRLLSKYHQITVQERYTEGDDTAFTIEKLAELRIAALRATASIVTFWYRGQVDLNVNASFMRLWVKGTYPNRDEPVLYAPAAGSTDILQLDGWAVQVDSLPTTLLLDVARERPRPGAPFAVVHERRDVVSNTQDATEWLQRDVTPDAAAEMLAYFRSVPFRSFFSIPLFDVFGREVIGAVSVQVDKPGIFVAGNRETEDLIELVNRFCYFLVWLEAKLRDAQLNAPDDATR